MMLRLCYAKCGTEGGYGATRRGRYWSGVAVRPRPLGTRYPPIRRAYPARLCAYAQGPVLITCVRPQKARGSAPTWARTSSHVTVADDGVTVRMTSASRLRQYYCYGYWTQPVVLEECSIARERSTVLTRTARYRVWYRKGRY
eukprot:502236-Rhodomonas_salina.1